MRSTIIILLFIFQLSYTAKADNDTIQPKLCKNAVRLEIGAKSPFFGFLYERKVINEKLNGYFSFGIGLGNTGKIYPLPTMYNLSFHVKSKQKWRINPILGVGIFSWVEYSPYPSTIEERKIFRSNGDGGGPPMRPPFIFYETAFTGLEIKFSKKWNCQLLYTHWFLYDFIGNEYIGSAPLGGLNFGYNF